MMRKSTFFSSSLSTIPLNAAASIADGGDLGAVDDVGTRRRECACEWFIDANLDRLSIGGATQESSRQHNRWNNSERPCHVVLQSDAVNPSAVQSSSLRVARRRRSLTP